MVYNKLFSILAFVFILLNNLAGSALGTGRGIISTTKKSAVVNHDNNKKLLQPESFLHDHGYKHHHDGTVLVPGLGRFYMFPRHETPFNPFTYKPITGNSSPGTGIPLPGSGGATTGRSYIPGGDDTFIPNPGVEVPNPSGGGSSSSTTPPVGP